MVDQQIWERGDWQGSGPSSKLVKKVGGQESASKESKSVEQAARRGEDEGDKECCWQQEQEGRVPTVFEELFWHGVGFCGGFRPLARRRLSNLGWRENLVGNTILAHPMHQVGNWGKWGSFCN